MFNKDFAKDPMKMSVWALYWFGFRFMLVTFFQNAFLTLAGVAGAIFMFLWAWQNLGF